MENKWEKITKSSLAKIKQGEKVPILKVIKLKCADCSGWQENEIRLCPNDDCILHPFRMGKNPIKRVLSDEKRQELAQRLKKNLGR